MGLSELFVLAGIGLILIGILLVFVGSVLGIGQQGEGKSRVQGAGVVFIGPFPVIGFASNKSMYYALIALIVIGLILWFFLGKK